MNKTYSNLEKLSKEIRHNVLRAILKSKASHIASAMSIVDILTILYGAKYINPEIPQLFLSKGHAGIAVYSTLRAIGIINEDMFSTYYENGSHLGGHVSHKKVPGVHLSTGSLGGGIAVANGVALANQISGSIEKTYVIVGDGECQEGSIWEAVIFASHHQLKSIVVIIDRNGLQGCGTDEEIMSLGDIGEKFLSFGWAVFNSDGHNFEQLKQALDSVTDKPKCIVAHTTKGKGVKFMENNNLWHYKNVTDNDYQIAINELGL